MCWYEEPLELDRRGGGDADWEIGLDPVKEGVEGVDDDFRGTSRVIPPRAASSSSSALIGGERGGSIV